MARRDTKMRVNRKGTNGTGRDIPTVYVPSRPAVPPFAARDKGDIAGLCPVCPACLARTPRMAAVGDPRLVGAVASEPAAGGRFADDIILPLVGRDLCVKVKARADGFRELYRGLAERDVLMVKADRREPLVVVRLSLAAEI